MKGRLGAVLLALPVVTGGVLLGTGRTAADAASSYTFREGVNGSDVVVDYDGEECPVIVRNETLTFYIDDLPTTQAEAEQSTSRVTASYELYNPTERDLTLTLYFPVGFKPNYLSAPPQNVRYSVTAEGADGAASSPELTPRYTYYERNYFGMTFELDGELPRSERNEETFFRPDTLVTKYTYTVTAPSDGKESYTFTFGYDANPAKTQVFSAESGASGISNGWGEIYRSIDAGSTQELVFYVIGKQLGDEAVRAGVYSASGASAELLSEADDPVKETMTFETLVQGMYAKADALMGVGDFYHDFYNATVAMLSSDDIDLKLTSCLNAAAVLENLMLWYEYELSVPAQGSVTNTVTAPLLPDLPSQTNRKWRYGYLLSSGQRWADVEEVVINIQTPYYLDSSSLQFTRREGGYTYSKDGLPMGELSFSFTRTEVTTYDPAPYDDETPTRTTALIILGVAVGVAVIAVVIVFCARARRKKEERAEEERLSRGKTEEGKIDLDPFPDMDKKEGSDGEEKNDGPDWQE